MKLSKVKFQNVPENQMLTKAEQALVFGGYSGSYLCYYEKVGGSFGCTNNRSEAYSNVKLGGYWCCDCDTAKSMCWY